MAFSATHRKINWRTFWFCLFLTIGPYSYGYAASIISTTLGQPVFLQYMKLMDSEGVPSKDLAALAGTTVGLFCTGGCIGVLVSSWAMDAWGRKLTVFFLSAVYLFGGILIVSAQNIAMFIVGRIFNGFGAIAFVPVCAAYIAELSQAESRGFFTGLTGVATALGYTSAALVGLGFSYTSDAAAQWRTPLGISLVPVAIQVVGLFFIPESPRHLLLKNKTEKAWNVLSHIHYDATDTDQAFVKEEFFQMQKQIEFDQTLDGSWIQLFRRPSYRKRMLMAAFLQFLGQSTAVLVVANYGPSLYAALGFNTKETLILQCGWIAGSIPASITGAALCDRFGRKPFIMTGFVGCAIFLSLLAAMLAVYAPDGTNKVGLGWAVAATYAVVICYCLGVESCGAPFYTEIFPTHIRAKGVCWTLFINSLVNIVYLEAAPTALQNIGWKFLLLFICILAIGSGLYWYWIPETKGVPLEELAAIFGDTDEVKVYSNDLFIGSNNEVILEDHVVEKKTLGHGEPAVEVHERV